MLKQIQQDLQKLANKEKAKIHMSFFKTKKGEYGAGDVFLGITVPKQRIIANKYKDLELINIQELLNSKIHEHRLMALFILTYQYKKSKDKKTYAEFYIKNSKRINNWDLVDTSAEKILGDYLFDKDKSILYKFAESENLWERRIAIISTFYFIKQNKFEDTFKIAKTLLNDKHDLIHKAVGWMLREVGKRNQKEEENFLQEYYKVMPRTTLRYAIEKFETSKKLYYMKK